MEQEKYLSLKRKKLSPNAKRITIQDPHENNNTKDPRKHRTYHNSGSLFGGDSSPSYNKKKKKKLFIYDSKKSNDHKDLTGSSALSYIPKGSDNDDDDEDEDGLIDINMMTMKKPKVSPKVDFSRFDDLVENAKSPKKESRTENHDTKSPIKKDTTSDRDIIHTVLTTKNLPQDIETVCNKFKSKKIPEIPQTKSQLGARVAKYLEIIPDLLNGTMTMSCFYDMAKSQRDKIGNDTLRQRDKYMINWDDFTGGYYGLKRQFYISSLILTHHKSKLIQKSKKNHTLAFWGIEDFCKFILSNEIIVRLVMEDYGCDLAKAESITKSTVEYGKIVSDDKELEDDLDDKTMAAKNPERGKSIEELFDSE